MNKIKLKEEIEVLIELCKKNENTNILNCVIDAFSNLIPGS